MTGFLEVGVLINGKPPEIDVGGYHFDEGIAARGGGVHRYGCQAHDQRWQWYGYLRMLLSPPSNDEKRRVRAKFIKNIEDTRCEYRVGTVVKRQRDGMLTIGTMPDRPPAAGSEEIGPEGIQYRPRGNST